MIWHFIKSKPALVLAPAPVPAPAPSLVPVTAFSPCSLHMFSQDQMMISIVNRGFNTARWSDISLSQNQRQLLLLILFLLLPLFLLLFSCSLHISCQDQMIISIINRGLNTARWSDISLSQNLLLLLLLLLFLFLLLLLLLLLCLHLAPFSLHMLCDEYPLKMSALWL